MKLTAVFYLVEQQDKVDAERQHQGNSLHGVEVPSEEALYNTYNVNQKYELKYIYWSETLSYSL